MFEMDLIAMILIEKVIEIQTSKNTIEQSDILQIKGILL